MYFFFFFKQKTAYEMRISDWSSDVCSSDLFLDLFVAFVHQGPHAAPLAAGNEDVADLESAALHQNGGDRPAAALQPGFDDDALGHAVRVRRELEHLGLQQDRLLELIEVGLLDRKSTRLNSSH